MLAWVQLVGGLILLAVAAEALVRGASRIASHFGVSSLVIGLTVVAYGTSAPELAVSVIASFRGNSGVALGNVIGSNIANIGLVLGASALVLPLITRVALLRREFPFLLMATITIPLLGADGSLGRLDGSLCLIGAMAFSFVCLRQAHRERKAKSAENDVPRPEIPGGIARNIIFIAVGSAGLVVGGHFLVEGAVVIASEFGISDRVIGLTVVAIGTSLPELATSLVSAARGELEMAVGNVIGSNIFNVFFILGTAAVVNPIVVPYPVFSYDVMIMIGLTVVMAPFILTGGRIDRFEGFLLLATYVAFLVTTVVQSG